MNIRQKSFLVIASSLTISAALNFGVLRLAVFPSFVELEHQRAIDDVSRVAAAIKSQVSEIDKTTVAYATWDDSYTHVLDSNVELIQANYYTTAMDNFDVNFVAIINRNRQPLYEAAYFKDQETILPAGELATAVIDPEGLLSVTSDEANPAGLLMTARGPLLVVARPILHSSGEGPSGSLIMGRLLNESLSAALSEATRVRFKLLPAAADRLDAQGGAALTSLQGGDDVVIEETPDGLLAAYTLIRDLYGRPALRL